MGQDYEPPQDDPKEFTKLPKTKLVQEIFEKNAEYTEMRRYFDRMTKRKQREIEERKALIMK